MNRLLFLICGICWLGFGAGAGFFLLQFLAHGAGAADIGSAGFGGVSPAGAMIGLVHFAGFSLLAAFCFLIGIGLLSYGMASGREDGQDRN